MGGIRCVSCTAKVDETTVVCPECGEDARTGGTPRTCKECGAPVSRDAISCSACGAHVPVETPVEPEVAPVGVGSTVTVRRGSGGFTAARGRPLVVLLDGKEVGKVWRKGALSVTIAPGPHTLAVKMGWYRSQTLEFGAEWGRDLAFACDYGISGGDVAVGVAGAVVSGLLGATGGSITGGCWVRQVTEPSGGDEQADVGATPPGSSV